MGSFIFGQKKILLKQTKPPLKGKTRKRKVLKESDWKRYRSSSMELQVEISDKGEEAFDFEILSFCDTKWFMSYLELWWQMQLNVLMRMDSYNGIVNVRLRKFPTLIEKYADEIRKSQQLIPR